MKAGSETPEAILIYGSPGSGKSRGWAEIARYSRQRGSDATFHVLSTEIGTATRIGEGYPKTDSDPGWDTNVVVHECRDWPSLIEATQSFQAGLKVGDWVVIDELGAPWQWVRDLWETTRPGYKAPDPTDPFAMLSGVEMNPDAWGKVKGAYYGWLNGILTSPAHTYACAHEDELRVEGGWRDSDEAVAAYKFVGMKAVTEKTAAYAFHSIIWARRTGKAQWAITTVDDPGREYATDEPVVDMVLSYLVPVAGWSL